MSKNKERNTKNFMKIDNSIFLSEYPAACSGEALFNDGLEKKKPGLAKKTGSVNREELIKG